MSTHADIRRLIGRRLAPGGGLSADEAGRLRRHLADCAACRRLYDRETLLRRAAAGTDAPLAAESHRLMQETLANVTAPAPRKPAWRLAEALLGAVTVAFLVLLALPTTITDTPRLAPPSGAEGLASRGDEEPLPLVGLGLSGIAPDGREYEVVAGAGACRADALRFYVTTRKPEADLSHYLIFGLQPRERVYWYFPAPDEAPGAYRVPDAAAGPHMVPWEVELAQRHAVGPLTVVALFAPTPLTPAAVAPAVASVRSAPGALDATALADAVSAALDVPVEAAVLETTVLDCGGR